MFTLTHETEIKGNRPFGGEQPRLPSTRARLGVLETAHGKVETPAFMPVASKGTVKLLSSRDLEELDVQALITNAFLLSLKPGPRLLEEWGGVHEFMSWPGPIFADSGGFQMIRQGFLLKVDDGGVTFRSPFDGKRTMLGPEDVIDTNAALGSDVVMMLDHVPEAGAAKELVAESLDRSLLWAKQGLDYFGELLGTGSLRQDQQFFCITQGGIFPDLRRSCIRELNNHEFDGYGIGGLCIGEEKSDMFRMVQLSDELIPRERMRYLMGVGKPEDIIRSVALGMDIFDSVFPTRNARHKTVLTRQGSYNIRAAGLVRDGRPLEEDCECQVCQRYSRAYIHHLCRSEEYVWMRLVTIHNLHFMMRLMREIRKAIREDAFEEMAKEYGVV